MKITYTKDPTRAAAGADKVVYLAPEKTWKTDWLSRVASGSWVPDLLTAAREATPGPKGAARTTVHPRRGGVTTAVAVVLPDEVSRHNGPARHEAIAWGVDAAGAAGADKAALIIAVDDPAHTIAVVNAAARKLPLFTRKKGRRSTTGRAVICVTAADGSGLSVPAAVRETVAGARWAAQAVDTPTAELTTAAFVREARRLVKGLAHVKTSVIAGDKLLAQGLGGIHAVGRTAMVAPRLLLLHYSPPRAQRTVALVGKGVVYDTGGLSLKGKTAMPSMKGDMGGGAAVAGAFFALASTGCRDRLVAAVPLAENAIGPDSYRPDDIIVMHSKKTVEINNTDAEGRLLLADAVSYVCRKHRPAAVIDAATLTGAQLLSSGLRHASIVSNREGLERLALRVGRECGDLTHALLFAPEFYQAEFESKVADMRNSVADRMNAQASCAAQFVYAHIDDLDVPWLHVDLAGPAWRDGRGTGFGVALLSSMVRAMTKSDLAS